MHVCASKAYNVCTINMIQRNLLAIGTHNISLILNTCTSTLHIIDSVRNTCKVFAKEITLSNVIPPIVSNSIKMIPNCVIGFVPTTYTVGLKLITYTGCP